MMVFRALKEMLVKEAHKGSRGRMDQMVRMALKGQLGLTEKMVNLHTNYGYPKEILVAKRAS